MISGPILYNTVIHSPDCNGNPAVSVGQGGARGIAMESRFPAPEKYI